MGEWSKKIGDEGERVVVKLLDSIGWNHIEKNIDIKCATPRHGDNTHGIDGVFSYTCPLKNDTLKIVVISVKYTTGKYPNSATEKFKDYLRDLSKAIKCFRSSEEFSATYRAHDRKGRPEVVGLLVWLTTESQDKDDDFLQKVADCRFSAGDEIEDIIVIDNARSEFIHNVSAVLENDYRDSTVEYYYPRTGENFDPVQSVSSGKILPIELLTSRVAVLRVFDDTNKKEMTLFCEEAFTESNLGRLIGLSKYLGGDWATKLRIYFPDYSNLEHKGLVSRVVGGFNDELLLREITVETSTLGFRR